MDRDELRLRQIATKKGLAVHKQSDGTWTIGSPVSTEALGPPPHEPFETLLSGERVRLKDGRVFKGRVTTAELRLILETDSDESSDS